MLVYPYIRLHHPVPFHLRNRTDSLHIVCIVVQQVRYPLLVLEARVEGSIGPRRQCPRILCVLRRVNTRERKGRGRGRGRTSLEVPRRIRAALDGGGGVRAGVWGASLERALLRGAVSGSSYMV